MEDNFIQNSLEINAKEHLKHLITTACKELRKSLDYYNQEEERNRKIIEAFSVPNYILSQVSKVALLNDMTDSNASIILQREKLEKLADKLSVSLLEKFFKSFLQIHDAVNEYHDVSKKEIRKYEVAYNVRESQTSEDDVLDLTPLQTSVLKLQVDIHEANEKEEQKELIIDKLAQCFEIKSRLDVCLEKKTKLMELLKDLRHLPPNLSEAEKRLDELKRKYKEVCDAFTRMVTNKI